MIEQTLKKTPLVNRIKNNLVTHYLLYFILIFFVISAGSSATSNTASIKQAKNKHLKKPNQTGFLLPYMDQVIYKKKQFIIQKCLKNKIIEETGFMLVEVEVSAQGRVQTRIVKTELKDSIFLQCVLSVLNRTRFKSFKNGLFVTRIYQFFVL